MTKEEINKLTQDIGDVSNNFDSKPFTENIRLLKEDFDLNILDTPQNYKDILDDISEILRQTRLLFLYSVLNKVCKQEEEIYAFKNPFQASMKYHGVMKKEQIFYLQDEDGAYREIFTSEKFVQFIDDEYWEIYE